MATYDYWNGTSWVEIPKVTSDPSAPSATNLVLDPYFADLPAWTFTGTATNIVSLTQSPPTETPSWVVTADGSACSISDSTTDLGKLSKIVPLATYRFTAWIKSTITRTGAASGITINGNWVRSDGTILGGAWSYPVATVAGTWVFAEFIVDAPSTATYVSFSFSMDTTVPSGTVLDFSYPCIQPMMTSNLIADGAIGSNELATDAVVASKIFAGAVTAGKIDTNAIVAGNIQSGAIIADKIAAGAVIADKIGAGEVTAGKLSTDSVDAVNIKANAITTEKINAGAVTTSRIDPAGIDGAVIVDGTLAANKLAANSLVIGNFDPSVGSSLDISGNATVTTLDGSIAATNTLAASKTVTFTSGLPAPSATTIGDLWINTDDGNHLYRASATGDANWVLVRDTSQDATLSDLVTGVNAAATSARVDALDAVVADKASKTSVTSLDTAINGTGGLIATVGTKADASAVSALNTTVNGTIGSINQIQNSYQTTVPATATGSAYVKVDPGMVTVARDANNKLTLDGNSLKFFVGGSTTPIVSITSSSSDPDANKMVVPNVKADQIQVGQHVMQRYSATLTVVRMVTG